MSVHNNSTISQATCAPANGSVAANRRKSTKELAHLAAVLQTVAKEVGEAKANVDAAAKEAGAAASSPNVSAPDPSTKGAISNFMYALMKAISRDQSSESQMQIVDALSTQMAVTIEQAMNKAWYAPYDPNHMGSGGILSKDEGKIQAAVGESSTNPYRATDIQNAQNQYNTDAATAQANISQQDGSVQGAQGQTSSDATNLQTKVQMAQTVNGIMSSLTNMLNGNITA